MAVTTAANAASRVRGAEFLGFLASATRAGYNRDEPFLRQYFRVFAACLLPWMLLEFLAFIQDVSKRLYWEDNAGLSEAWIWGARAVMSAVLTPFILWIGARWPLEYPAWWRRFVMHALIAIVFSIVRIAMELGVLYGAMESGFIKPMQWLSTWDVAIATMAIYGLHPSFVRYWCVISIQAALRYYEQFRDREREARRLDLHAAELRAQIAQARLDALKMQLQPHFLFNTLNAIVVLVRQQRGAQAEEALTRFSDLLRALLEDIEAHEVPLHRELDCLRLYLSVERMRFSDRLQTHIDADPDVLNALVPHMGLQPIVENAVRHGIGRRVLGGLITVRARRVGENVEIVVTDDGPGVCVEKRNAQGSQGLGVANCRARLRQLHGDRAELRLENSPRGGAKVTVVLPYTAAQEDSPPIGGDKNGESEGHELTTRYAGR